MKDLFALVFITAILYLVMPSETWEGKVSAGTDIMSNIASGKQLIDYEVSIGIRNPDYTRKEPVGENILIYIGFIFLYSLWLLRKNNTEERTMFLIGLGAFVLLVLSIYDFIIK